MSCKLSTSRVDSLGRPIEEDFNEDVPTIWMSVDEIRTHDGCGVEAEQELWVGVGKVETVPKVLLDGRGDRTVESKGGIDE